MNRHCLDWRVLAPIAVGAVLFALRPATLPPRGQPSPQRTIELPTPVAGGLSQRDADYELDAERSTVRFFVDDGAPRFAACPGVRGSLQVRTGTAPSTLELELDLGSLQPLEANAPLDLWRLLGVHRGGRITYRAELLRTATSPLPGVTERVWLGTLRLDEHAVRQPMSLWQVSLPGQPLRLQGHGTVAGATYDLPTRGWLGLAADSHAVTLGLDLVWRRRRAR